MPHLDFDASHREHTGEPITFALAGRKLTCVQDQPFIAVADLYKDGVATHTSLLAFFEAIVVDDDIPALHEALRDKTRIVTTKELDAAADAIQEAYTGRPPMPSETSSSTPSDGGQSSKPGASSPAAASTS